MHLEHHLVGGYVRYISPHIIIIITIIIHHLGPYPIAAWHKTSSEISGSIIFF